MRTFVFFPQNIFIKGKSGCLRMESTMSPSLIWTSTNNVTSETVGQGESMTTKIVRIIGYAILFIFGVFGNSLVILAVRKPRMKTVTNVMIANLGLADLLVALFNIPSVVTYAHLWKWPFGEVLCKVLPFLQGLTLCASIGTLLGIALDRYWHIVLFKRRKIQLKEAYKVIAVIWLSSVIIPMPLLVFCKILIVARNGTAFVLCEEVWPNLESRKAYSMILFLVLYLFPLLAISILYAVIARSLKRQPLISSSLEKSRQHAQRRIIRMLIIVVILFAFCWLPYHVTFLYIDYFNPIRTQALVTSILFSQWLVFASSACNPVVYALLNHNYRREFVKMLAFCRRTVRPKSPNQEILENGNLGDQSKSTTPSYIFITSV